MSEKRARQVAKRKRQLKARRNKCRLDDLAPFKTLRVEAEEPEEFLAILQGPELDPEVWPEAIREDMADFVLGLRAEGEAAIVRTKPNGDIRIIAESIVIDLVHFPDGSWRQDWIQISGVHFDQSRVNRLRELAEQARQNG